VLLVMSCRVFLAGKVDELMWSGPGS
jgi:hypothetical protein